MLICKTGAKKKKKIADYLKFDLNGHCIFLFEALIWHSVSVADAAVFYNKKKWERKEVPDETASKELVPYWLWKDCIITPEMNAHAYVRWQ